MNNVHLPVMLEEVMEYLDPCPGEIIVDGTLGGGGYTKFIADRVGPQGKVLGIDLDPQAIVNFKKNNSQKQIELIEGNFGDLEAIVKERLGEEKKIDGLVLDLGLSSNQLADANRGFSFQDSRPLDMAFGPQARHSTSEIVNHYSLDELTRIFRLYGEETKARVIAQAIIRARQNEVIATTARLVEVILSVVPKTVYTKIHPATKVFQALRIATNTELDNLERVLLAAVKVLAPRGRLVIVSFHSLEDRIVKEFFRDAAKDCVCPPNFPVCRCNHRAQLKLITKKALIPSPTEIDFNPRARSAKLRAAAKI